MKSSDAVQAGIILACGVVSAAAGGALSRSRRAPGRGLEDVLGVGLSLLGVVIVGLWLLTLAVAVIAEILERRGLVTAGAFAGQCAPAFMRRLAAALMGVQLLAVPAVAQAAPGSPDTGTGSAVTGPAVLPAARSASGAGTGADTSGRPGSPYWSPLATSTRADGQDGQDGEEVPPGPPVPMAPVSPVSPTSEPVPTSEPAPVSPAWEPAPASPTSEPAPASPTSEPAPVSPAWEPAPMPSEGGLLVRPDTRRTAPAEVVVAPGDSLWSIAARRLGPLATAADIAEAWPAWFDANRPVIGDDPSLLLPGQVLQAPSP
ncbi:LysM peptidoglycan-binding domain-containing protein [Arthrobacter sp. MDT2-2]